MVAPDSNESTPKRKLSKERKKKLLDGQPETLITCVLKELTEDVGDVERNDNSSGHGSHLVAQSVFRSYPADMVYVERRNGFTAAPRKKVLTHSDNQKEKIKKPNENTSPFELAITVQEACRPVFVLSHGLLGGMSFVLIMLMLSVGWDKGELEEFLNVYDDFARPIQTTFYLLSAISLVSVFDRCDIAQTDRLHVGDLCHYHLVDIVLLLLYTGTFMATLATSCWDERLAFHHFSPNVAWINSTETQSNIIIWRNLNLGRCVGGLSGWIIMALSPSEDMLHARLTNILKYQLRSASHSTALSLTKRKKFVDLPRSKVGPHVLFVEKGAQALENLSRTVTSHQAGPTFASGY